MFYPFCRKLAQVIDTALYVCVRRFAPCVSTCHREMEVYVEQGCGLGRPYNFLGIVAVSSLNFAIEL